MKINFGNQQKSPNYDAVAERTLKDPATIRFLTAPMSVGDMRSFAKNNQIEIWEVSQLRMLVTSQKKAQFRSRIQHESKERKSRI